MNQLHGVPILFFFFLLEEQEEVYREEQTCGGNYKKRRVQSVVRWARESRALVNAASPISLIARL